MKATSISDLDCKPDSTRCGNLWEEVVIIKSTPNEAATSLRGLTKSPPEPAMTREVSMATPKNSPAIAPDDRRHGTNVGYNLGCRANCCRHAHMVWMKLWRMNGSDRLVSGVGFTRRIRALQAIGYTSRNLSAELGRSKSFVDATVNQRQVRRETHEAMHAVFERLCMTLPTGWVADRARRQAADRGYAPPLAWDDIDNPDAVPSGTVRLARCGTDSAYKRHLRYGEEPCDPCRDAHRDVRAAERKVA